MLSGEREQSKSSHNRHKKREPFIYIYIYIYINVKSRAIRNVQEGFARRHSCSGSLHESLARLHKYYAK